MIRPLGYPTTARPMAPRLLALLAAVYLVLTIGARSVAAETPGHSSLISGPAAWLLTASKGLGPAHKDRISVAASLQHAARPGALIGWAQRHHLNVQWQSGADWAYIDGNPADVGSALNVAIHDYRSRSGQVFYASAQQPVGCQHDDRSVDGQLGQQLHLEQAGILVRSKREMPTGKRHP